MDCCCFAVLQTPGSFVGLKNQGATCYMNSLFQQLFAVPEFRHNLLCMKTQRDSETDPADDTLYQLQVLFGSLLVSPLRYLDTMPLCRTFRDFDGEPVRMSEQKDVSHRKVGVAAIGLHHAMTAALTFEVLFTPPQLA